MLESPRVQVQNTFITVKNINYDDDSNNFPLLKAFSMPPYKDERDYYIQIKEFDECEHTLQETDARSDHDEFHLLGPSLETNEGSCNEALSEVDTKNIPKDVNGNLTSIGSINHSLGTCKPCAFHHHRTKVCTNGVSCEFCHFEHDGKRRPRNNKTNVRESKYSN